MDQRRLDDTDSLETIRIAVLATVSKSRLLAVNAEPDTSGYAVTHIPTGYVVTYFESRNTALRVMEDLEALDWEFDDPDDAKQRSKGVAEVLKRYVDESHD